MSKPRSHVHCGRCLYYFPNKHTGSGICKMLYVKKLYDPVFYYYSPDCPYFGTRVLFEELK